MQEKRSSHWAGGGVNGKYKDMYFRSLIELSYIIQNYDSLQNAETSQFRIKYSVGDKTFSYSPDFYNKETDTIIEIKHSYAIQKMSEKLKAKITAAQIHFKNYLIVTEKDIEIIKLDALKELVKSNIVFLNPRSFKKFFT